MRFLGVPVRFDFSAIVLAVIGDSIAIHAVGTELPLGLKLALGAAGFVLLVLSILWHERGHIFAAGRYGICCSGILIFGLGGIAFLEGPSKSPREAFAIAIAGPIASAIAAAGFFVVAVVIAELFPNGELVWQLLARFAMFNVVLGAFNLIPVFPLDGGRVSYSAIWAVVRDEAVARRLCVLVSRVFLVVVFAFVLLPMTFSGRIHPFSLVWYLLIAFMVWKMQTAALDRPM